MSSLRNMHVSDLFHLTSCNLDPLTETYAISFYLDYLARWPYCCFVLTPRHNPAQIDGYILGKLESSPPPNRPTSEPYDPDTNRNEHFLPWHAHITALSVSPAARRLGHARKLTAALEAQGDAARAWFVDLYVRRDNAGAIALYTGMGYSVFRRVPEYYADGCDAFDMRKPLARDAGRRHVRADGESHVVDAMHVW